MYFLLSLKTDFPALYSLFLFLFFLLIAVFVNSIIKYILCRLVGKTETELDDELMMLLKRPIFWSIILFGFFLSLKPLLYSTTILELTRKIFFSVVFIGWGIVGIEAARLFFHEYKKRHRHISTTMIPFLNNVIKISIILMILLVVMNTWGINITPALASAGVVGVALAFAARDTVSNLFGGISVFFDKPYKMGDYVIVNDKYRGEVVEIGMRSTKIRTRDNILLTVPNSVMITNAVINETGFDPKLRVRIPLSVAYETDLEKAENVLLDIVKQYSDILERPKPKVRFREFGDSGIHLELLCMISKPADRGKVVHNLIKKISNRFKKEKVIIPFPQRDVHLSSSRK